MQYYRSIVTSLTDRAILYGNYIVKYKATVRNTAKAYGVGKSSVHKAVTEHLKTTDPILYEKVQKVLLVNKALSHLRGGQVIKERYAK